MKQIKSICLLALSVVLSVACSSDSDSPKEEPKTTTQDVVFDSYDQLQKEVTLTGLAASIDNIENNNSWVTNVAPQTYSGTGSLKVTITVAANTSKDKRVGVVTVKDAKKNTVILTVTQPAYQAKQYSQALAMAANGESKDITLTDLTTAISSIDTSVSWLTVTQQSYTSGSPTITVKAEANTQETARQATIVITATNGDQVTLTITQDAKEPSNIEDVHNTESDQPAYSRQF